ILQLLEKAVLHFFMASVQPNNQEAKNTDNDYFQPSLQHNEGNLETAIAPSHGKLVAPLQLLVKTLTPEGSIWNSEKHRTVLPILWGLHPSVFKNFMVEPGASSSGSFKRFKASPVVNTAIFTEKQVELLQKLVDDRVHEFTEDEFMNVVDYFSPINFGKDRYGPYLESPALIKGFVRNGILKFNEIPKDKVTKDMLLVKNNLSGYGYDRYGYTQLPDELKKDHDFLIEYSRLNGIPFGTPPELAAFIYGYLDITAKIKSLKALPASFKSENDELYEELIRSGMIELRDLPEPIKNKNKEYCLSQLADGLCQLSEVPAHFMTKESILDSINGNHWYLNFGVIFSGFSGLSALSPFSGRYNMFTRDPVFFEELLLKAVTVDLEMFHRFNSLFEGGYDLCLEEVYSFASKRYKADREKFDLLLKRLIKANPFVLVYAGYFNKRLSKVLVDAAKDSLLEILNSRPEVSRGFHVSLLDEFFEKVNADNDFKTHVLNIVYQYMPNQNEKREKLPEGLLKAQDDIVLKSEPFGRGIDHFLTRNLRPDNPQIVLDYIEQNACFLYFFKDKEYLEKCSADPIIRQKFIHVLAQKLVADKLELLRTWQKRLPRPLLDDTLDFLKDPALFFKLDSSDQLTEPVNPLKFQLPNTSAFGLVVAAAARGFGFHPADEESGRQLQSRFDRAGETPFQRVYPGQHPLTLFEKEGTIVDGRTLAIANGEVVDHYKFQRVGESLATLAREGIMHEFIAKNDRLKSQKPRFGDFLVVLEKDLPQSTQGFTDRLQVNYVDGERAFLVYYFQATDNYSKYAHTPDETSTPYAAAERGLLNSIHDIGVLNGNFGIIPASTMQAFHCSGCRWVFLSPLLKNTIFFAFPLPGKFERWIEAIERPQFGWNGLRDWGDIEFYGSMKSGLTARNSKTSGYTPEVFQRLSFANALCENLLAAVLLRSRLRRESPDYHYQIPQAVKETENFIEQLLNEYLSGLFAKEKERQPKSRLQTFMRFDDAKYRSWLTRTAQEILYWTAPQPDEVTDPCASTLSSECYSEHLKRTGHLDKILYPAALHPLEAHKKFPRDFRRANGQPSLGADRAVFPLVSLVKGLTLFASHIFAFADQYMAGDNPE
ncbi:hypothetical protein, partial [Endozoicomonas sp. ONNA1]|uniref:hypothetical protein n=1 Tax=Endozoicomonas sp. ONNA1 TaxID=2828740 RepID=UPI0021484F03